MSQGPRPTIAAARWRYLRRLGALGAVCALLVIALPAAAQQGNYSGHCRRLSKQIGRYEGQVDLAQARGNGAWEASTQAHVKRLRARRSQLCPEYDQWLVTSVARKSAEQMADMIVFAGKTALSYFTGGAL